MPSIGSDHYHEPDVVTNTISKMKVRVAGGEWAEKENVRVHEAHCACGFRGPTRTHYWEADEDCTEHRRVENG